MSADQKPDKPADVPPFLQSTPGQSRDGNPKPVAKPDPAPEIPYFLRAGAAAVPAEPNTPRPKPAAPTPPPTKDPGLLHSLVTKLRPASPPQSSPPPPRPSEDKPAPAFLRPEAQPPESEVELPGLLSPEEVQRKLEEVARATEKKDTGAPVTPVPTNQPPPPPRAPSKPIDWESAPAIFEQMVEGIRRDRVSHEKEMLDQQSKIEQDWQHVLDSMRALQKKVEGHPNLIYFTISRDQQDISVKVADFSTKRGYSLFTLSRRHPAGAHPSLNAVWLIEFPAREWHYYDAKEAMAELVARIAGALA